MMRRALLILVLILSSFHLRGQDYDAALESFAAITNECLRLKARLNEGETLPPNALDGIQGELRSLQKDLQQASGSMTPAQKDRYRTILTCYRDGRMVPLAVLTATGSPLEDVVHETIPLKKQMQVLSFLHGHLIDPVLPQSKSFLLATASFPLEGGLTFGHIHRRWGGYLHVSGNGFYPSGTIDALSDGSSDEGFIWTSGATRTGRFSASIGVVWLPNSYRSTSIGLYTGAGYGFSRLHWQTIDDKWALITDKSVSAPILESGGILFHRHFSFSAGISTIAFHTVSITAGMGFNF